MPLNDTLLLMTTQLEAQLLDAKLARKRMAEEIPPSRSPRATRATTGWRSIVAIILHAPDPRAASTVR
jgi:hypothetical protein